MANWYWSLKIVYFRHLKYQFKGFFIFQGATKKRPQRQAKKRHHSEEEDDEEEEEEEEEDEEEEDDESDSDAGKKTKKKRRSKKEEEDEEDSDDNGFNDASQFPPKDYTVSILIVYLKVFFLGSFMFKVISYFVFLQSGAFVVAKADVGQNTDPTLWRIDGKALLQKYLPFKEDGKTLYKSTSTV